MVKTLLMQPPLSHIYNSTTQPELGNYARDLITSIPTSTLTDGGRPFIITTNGDPNSGKSYIWDVIKNTLFQEKGTCVYKIPNWDNAQNRILEIWQGTINKTDDAPLSVIFANYNLMTEDEIAISQKLHDLFLNIANPQAPNLKHKISDLLILSNVPPEIENLADIAINLNYVSGHSEQEWVRRTTIAIPDNSLQYSDKVQEFFQQYHP